MPKITILLTLCIKSTPPSSCCITKFINCPKTIINNVQLLTLLFATVDNLPGVLLHVRNQVDALNIFIKEEDREPIKKPGTIGKGPLVNYVNPIWFIFDTLPRLTLMPWQTSSLPSLHCIFVELGGGVDDALI